MLYRPMSGFSGPIATARYSRAFLYLMVLMVLLLAGCAQMQPQAEPEVGSTIVVDPTTSKPGQVITVTGADWLPDDVIYLTLESPAKDQPLLTPVAVARTDEAGAFLISFIYPVAARPIASSEVSLFARSATSSASAMAKLSIPELIAGTAEPTALPPVAVNTALANRGQVIGEFVNVRQGPSRANVVLAVAQNGNGFTVFGQDGSGDWLRVRLDNGVDGWIARAFTDYVATSPIVQSIAQTTASTPVILNWRGEYFNNRTLSGTPILVRNDTNVKFDWGFSSPSSLLPADNFSARWTRRMVFPAGTYRFFMKADDGMRLWIDGERVIDEWTDAATRTFSAERTFATTNTHFFHIDYYENTERAGGSASMSSRCGAAPTITTRTLPATLC